MLGIEAVSNHIIWRGESFESLTILQMTKKNAIQGVWSSITPLWFASLLKTPQTMKHFILISIMALICLGCNGQPTALTNIPDMEYGDCEPNTEPEINYIMFDLSNILEFAYNIVDNEYYIDYNDPDAFDLDNLAYLSGMDKWYANYIMVQLTEADCFELLEDVNKSKKEQWDITMSEKWVLKEVATPVEGGTNYKYYLIKNPIYAE